MSPLSKEQLEYIVNHVFLPPMLPGGAEPEELAAENDHLLCQLVLDAVVEFSGEGLGMSYTPMPENPRRWRSITKLLRNRLDFRLNPSAREITASLCAMDRGGVSKNYRNQIAFATFDSCGWKILL